MSKSSESLSAMKAIARLESLGARLTLVGDRIRIETPKSEKVDESLIANIREHKPEVMAYLKRDQDGACPLDDEYSLRLRAAIQEVCGPDYPAGMIPWLREAYPILHVELTDGLPNEIQRLWEAQVPTEEFQNVLDIWVEAHRMACEMYEKHLPAKGLEASR